MFKQVTYLLLFFVLISSSFALTTINNCGYVMNSPGETYELINNISISGGTCLALSGNSMILDCKGFTLTGNQTLYHDGIDISNDHNNTVKNCKIENFASGLDIRNSHNNTFENITISNSIYPGIYFWSNPSNNNTFRDISIYDTNGDGINSNGNSVNNNYENIIIENFTSNGFLLNEENSKFENITVLGIGGNSCVNFLGSHNNNIKNLDVRNCSNGLSIGVWTRSTNNYFENVLTRDNANGVKISGNSTNNTLDNINSNYNDYGVYFQNDGYENNILNSDLRNNNIGNVQFFANTVDQKDNLFQNSYLGNSSSDIGGDVSDNNFNNNYYDNFNGTLPFCFGATCDNLGKLSSNVVTLSNSVSLPSFGMWSGIISLIGIVLFLF